MKKFYTLAALALAVSMSASASDLFTSKSQSIANATFQTEIKSAPVAQKEGLKMKKAGPAKKVSSAKDLEGVYVWSFYGLLSNNEGPKMSSGTILAGEVENQVIFSGFPYTDVTYPGIFDPAAQTITLTKYNTGVQGGDGKGNYMDIYFVPMQYVEKQIKEVNKIVGKVGEDGSIVFDEFDCFALAEKTPTGSYWWLSCMNELTIPDYFKYNAAEWKDLGTGQYEDGYFNTLLDASGSNVVPAYDVTIQYNVNNKTQMLVKNPYPMSVWSGFNAGGADGYIVFDISDPNCVVVRPLVKSDMYTEEQDGSMTNYLLFNDEGYKYYTQGWEKADIVEEKEAVGADVSCVDGNSVMIFNEYFSLDVNPLGLYSWVDSNREPLEFLPTVITLPAGWEAGVESIIGNENAPVKYFNLQGMEVANPEAGALVIEKRGNKSVKRIMK